jgi:hypothetical protein
VRLSKNATDVIFFIFLIFSSKLIKTSFIWEMRQWENAPLPLA